MFCYSFSFLFLTLFFCFLFSTDFDYRAIDDLSTLFNESFENKDYELALEISKEMTSIYRRMFGQYSPCVSYSLFMTFMTLIQKEDYVGALKIMPEVREAIRISHGEEDPKYHAIGKAFSNVKIDVFAPIFTLHFPD